MGKAGQGRARESLGLPRPAGLSKVSGWMPEREQGGRVREISKR